MIKLRQVPIVAISAALVAMSFWSCEAAQTITANYDVYGSAVNAQSASIYSGLGGKSVTLTNYYNASSNYATSIDNSGNFSFTGIPGGKYIMTGNAPATTGTFIPIIVTVSGANSVLPNLLFLPYSATPAGITVVMTWENKNTAMNLVMAYGPAWGGTSPSQNPNILSTANTYNDPSNYWTATKTNSATYQVQSITLTAKSTSLSESYRFYISSNLAGGITGNLPLQEPAGATVHVFSGNNYKGSYFAPFDTDDQILRMCSINIAPSGPSSVAYTIHADIQSQTDTAYRGLNSMPTVGIPVANFY